MERVLKRTNHLAIPPIATARTLVEFIKTKTRGEKLPIPRTSLTITAALFATFPEKISIQETLEKVSQISPLMIALNERADIGISAGLRIEDGNLTQQQIWGLLMLKGQTTSMLDQRTSEFLQKYPQEEGVIRTIIGDFLTLSRLRGKFSPQEWPQFLELDSAIFVCAFIHAANSEILKDAGLEIEKPAKNKEELMEKYRIFITNNTDSLTEIQKRLRALLAAEMLLKVRDDLTDRDNLGIDPLLHLPNLAKWAKIINPDNPNQEIEKIKRKYQEEAKILFPRTLQVAVEIIFHITSVIKAKNSQNRLSPIDDPTDFWRCFTRISQTTTLRHELEAMCVLSGLFK